MIKTGIDIIEVTRIEQNVDKYGEKFLKRIFTEKEINYCESRNVQKYQSYAGRFAAKEAVFKAVSGSLDNKFNVEWKDIEVLNDMSGRPYVNLTGKLKEMLSQGCNIDVSISHIEKTAVASCILQF